MTRLKLIVLVVVISTAAIFQYQDKDLKAIYFLLFAWFLAWIFRQEELTK